MWDCGTERGPPYDEDPTEKKKRAGLKTRKRHLNGRSRVFHWDGNIIKKKRSSLIIRGKRVNKKMSGFQHALRPEIGFFAFL